MASSAHAGCRLATNERLQLKLVAGLLGYPGENAFWQRLDDRQALAAELDARLGAVCRAFRKMGAVALEQCYVAAFDFDAKSALYVTAHEMGDSRDRGQALIELTELYRSAGFEVPDDQLADYLPLMLEFAALEPDAPGAPLLERMARAAGQIAAHLGSDHPYHPLFEVVQAALGHGSAPVVPSTEENPDLADLPYPLQYS